MGKTQTEVPGTERPSIESIDEAASTYLEAMSGVANAKEEVKRAKRDMLEQMTKHISELAHDSEGDHIYAYTDGDTRKVFVLAHSDSIRVRNEKKLPTEPAGEID